MNTQLKKGILEMCVLFELSQAKMYGYELMKKIKNNFTDVYDGSIYAILRRLDSDGYTETFYEESNSGPPRKYYSITDLGSEYLKELTSEWTTIKTIIENMGL